MMNFNNFLDRCKTEVMNYLNQKIVNDRSTLGIGINDIYVVWYCKTLKNVKALLGTSLPDNLYFEITFNGDSDELYLDVYDKLENRCIKI